MKGLILKDLICLRKQLIVFTYVVVSVFVIAVMFVCSVQYGNIALSERKMLADGLYGAGFSMTDIYRMILALFMLLPIASIGDMANVFEADGKAGFSKVSSVMPLSVGQRVLARYITIFVMLVIGVLVDLLIAFVLSLFTDLVSFGDFFGMILSAGSLMSIYSAIVIILCFLFGYGKEDRARIVALLSMALVFVLFHLEKTKAIFMDLTMGTEDAEGPDGSLWMDTVNSLIVYIKDRFYLLVLLAIAVIVGSYSLSVVIAQKKRGVV